MSECQEREAFIKAEIEFFLEGLTRVAKRMGTQAESTWNTGFGNPSAYIGVLIASFSQTCFAVSWVYNGLIHC